MRTKEIISALESLRAKCTSWESWERECSQMLAELRALAASVPEPTRTCPKDGHHCVGFRCKITCFMDRSMPTSAPEHPLFGKMESAPGIHEKELWDSYVTEHPPAERDNLQMQLDASVNAEEHRQIKAERDALKFGVKPMAREHGAA